MSLVRNALLVGTSILMCSEVWANDVSLFEIQRDTNWTTAGFGGMRGVGTGTLTLAGIDGPVTQALLYWAGPTNSNVPTANANVAFSGTPVVGHNIGFTADNNWGFQNSQAYRADVTSLVSGNGSYSLSAFTKPDAEINGASLVVFFNGTAPKRDVALFNGNDSNQINPHDSSGWTTTLAGINYTSGSASLVLNVSDGQNSDRWMTANYA